MPGNGSSRDPSTCVAPAASSSSLPYLPVATPTDTAPAPCAAAMSSGVSPTTNTSAAQGAGAVSVGVATGKYGKDELEAAGATHVLGSLEEPFPGI